MASGKAVGAYSLTEPMSGSDAGTMRSRAVRDGDHYVINGRKSWVTSGPVADYLVVFTHDRAGEETSAASPLSWSSQPTRFRARQEGAQAGHPRLCNQRDRV